MVVFSPTDTNRGGESNSAKYLFLLQVLELADVIPGRGLSKPCLFAALREVYAGLISLYLSHWRSTWVRFLWYWEDQAILSRIPVFLHGISRQIGRKAHILPVLKRVRGQWMWENLSVGQGCFSDLFYFSTFWKLTCFIKKCYNHLIW